MTASLSMYVGQSNCPLGMFMNLPLIRTALGAQFGRVLRMVLGEASLLALAGVSVGLTIAISIGRFIASMLYELKPYDPLTLSLAALLLIVVALGASWLPARRAARFDPIKALRHE